MAPTALSCRPSVGKLRLVPAVTKDRGLQMISYGCFRLIDATEVDFEALHTSREDIRDKQRFNANIKRAFSVIAKVSLQKTTISYAARC
jgi:hypothetical protein